MLYHAGPKKSLLDISLPSLIHKYMFGCSKLSSVYRKMCVLYVDKATLYLNFDTFQKRLPNVYTHVYHT